MLDFAFLDLFFASFGFFLDFLISFDHEVEKNIGHKLKKKSRKKKA